MTEMFGEAWSPMSVPDLAPDDDDDLVQEEHFPNRLLEEAKGLICFFAKNDIFVSIILLL